jgi:ribose-phosphate pyrophosphokinase
MQSIIFSVDGRKDLVHDISEELCNIEIGHEVHTGRINIGKFSDGEVCADFETSVRGKRVYLVSTPNTSDKVLQLNFAIDAAKRAAAKEIIPIITYFPYARQDKKDQVRGPIGAKVLAEMLENRGATQVVTFDLHADQIQGFFNIPVTHMEGKYLFDRCLHDLYVEMGDSMVLCAPDAGAAKRVKHFRDQLKTRWAIDLPIVMIDKTRPKANEVGEMVLIGDVKDKNVIIIDDMCDTGGTLVKACDELLEKGAMTVRAIVTHGVLSGPALERINNSKLEDFICSNSLPLEKLVQIGSHKIWSFTIDSSRIVTQISTARQIAKAIIAINNNVSVEALKQNNY